MNMRSVRAATCCCSLSVWALRHFSRGETHVMESWQFANTLNVFCTNTFVDDSCLLSCFHKVFKVLEDRFEASQTVWRSAVSLTGCVSTFLQYVRGRGGRWDHRGHTSRSNHTGLNYSLAGKQKPAAASSLQYNPVSNRPPLITGEMLFCFYQCEEEISSGCSVSQLNVKKATQDTTCRFNLSVTSNKLLPFPKSIQLWLTCTFLIL